MNEPPNSRYLAAEAQRPAHRVDHAVERLLDLPDLLHAELPLLWVLGAEVEVADRRAGEVALGALGQHGGLGDQVGAGLEVRELLAVAAAALVARAHAHHPPVVHQELAAAVSPRMYTPASSACSDSQRPSWATEVTWLPWLLNGGGVGLSGIARLRLGSR